MKLRRSVGSRRLRRSWRRRARLQPQRHRSHQPRQRGRPAGDTSTSMAPSRSTSKRCSSTRPTIASFQAGDGYRKKEAWDKVASTLRARRRSRRSSRTIGIERGYALEEQARRRRSPGKRRKEPLQEVHRERSEFRRLLPRARLREPLDRQRAGRARPTTRRPSSTRPTSFGTTSRSPTSTFDFGYIESGGAGAERGEELREARRRQGRSSACTCSARRSTRSKGQCQRHGHRARSGEEGRGRRAPEILFNLGSHVRGS